MTFEVTRISCVESTNELSADEIHMTLFSGGPVGAPVMLGPRKPGDSATATPSTSHRRSRRNPLVMRAADGFQTFPTVGYCAEVDRDEYFDLMQVIYQELLTDGTVRMSWNRAECATC